MKSETHAAVQMAVRKFWMAERTIFMFDNHARAWEQRGMPDLRDLFSPFGPELVRIMNAHMRDVVVLCKGTLEGDFIKNTKGLGVKTLLLLGFIPPLEDMKSVRACYKYTGLGCDENGLATKKQKNVWGGYSTKAQAVCMIRIGKPASWQGPYREPYLGRRKHTDTAHPLMLKRGEGCPHCDESYAYTEKKRKESGQSRERLTVGKDCSHFGGIHWTTDHQDADARRFVAKAVVKDLWNVVHGREPTYGHDFAFMEQVAV